MKKFLLLFFLFTLFFSTSYTQDNSFENLLVQKELNPSIYSEAKQEALNQNLPIGIKLPEGILIDVLKVENGIVLYSIIKNSAHPFINGEVLSYDQITSRYDLSDAEINWGSASFDYTPQNAGATQLLLIPDWSNDNVLSFDPVTGDLINANFIPPSPGILASPKHALINSAGFISVSDQITDLVQKFDTAGIYTGIFAPAGGVNNAILDNLRGHAYRPNGNLVVTVGGGANDDGIPEFDAGGNYLGNFIANGAGGMNSPFSILFRTNDVLVTASTSDAAHRYDLNGTYLNDLITGINFPQQIIELSNGNLAVAVFSTPSGLGIYNSTGGQINFFTQVTGLRGVYQLPNGNYLVTNGTGLHEIDGSTGTLIRTIYSASNLQYISLVDYSIIPVELTTFSANVIGSNAELKWSTATELNNSGFEILRSDQNDKNWKSLGFVEGYGTTTEAKEYSYTDNLVHSGTFYYKLKQIDFDGSFEYSNVVRVDFEIPKEFSLLQNYPNPFNPETRIKYYLPFESNVKITVYNSIGEKLNELVNGFKNAGAYETIFNAENFSSGIYFYSIEASSTDGKENFKSVKKMMIVK